MKRKISAREAVVDIRSGKSDADLMDKYRLTATGLQSLFDKLVSAGYLDLSEVQGRIASFVGTVVIPQPDSLREEGTFSDDGHADRKTKQILINAQEAARDIRLRMSDSSLMEKHRLSAKGLQSMFNKLITVGIITQADLDARYSDADHTVDLKEQMPTLTQVLAHWELKGQTTGAEEISPLETAKRNADKMLPSELGQLTETDEAAAPGTITEGPTKRSYMKLVMAAVGLLILLLVAGFLATWWPT